MKQFQFDTATTYLVMGIADKIIAVINQSAISPLPLSSS
jgi:hypothetical protein